MIFFQFLRKIEVFSSNICNAIIKDIFSSPNIAKKERKKRIFSFLVHRHFLFFARLVTTLWRSTTIVQAANSICSCCSFEQQIEFRWRFRVTSGKYCYSSSSICSFHQQPTTILAVYLVHQPFPYAFTPLFH